MTKQKKLGLALGSGGWRAPAHIGVIKTLLKHGISIDYIAGSSAGSLVGGAFAALNDIDAVEKIFRENMNHKKLLYAFSDPRPREGLFKGEKIQNILDTYFGEYNIEDCSIPFIALATDIITGQVVELNKGQLSHAMRAAISVPFFLRPVEWGDKLLIDGATAVPIPVKTVKQMGAEVVIAINLQKNQFPMAHATTNTLNTAFKTSQVMLYHLANYAQQDADLVLYPNIDEHGEYTDPFTSFFGKRDAFNPGIEIAEQHIDQIKKLLFD